MKLNVFDARSYEVLATVPAGQRVRRLTPDGRNLYAANSLSDDA